MTTNKQNLVWTFYMFNNQSLEIPNMFSQEKHCHKSRLKNISFFKKKGSCIVDRAPFFYGQPKKFSFLKNVLDCENYCNDQAIFKRSSIRAISCKKLLKSRVFSRVHCPHYFIYVNMCMYVQSPSFDEISDIPVISYLCLPLSYLSTYLD